jgi:hypothetical protein
LNEHIIATLASIHTRLTRLENHAHLAGREITKPTLEETLSWSKIWYKACYWYDDVTYDYRDTSFTLQLQNDGNTIAKRILSNPGPYTHIIEWAKYGLPEH